MESYTLRPHNASLLTCGWCVAVLLFVCATATSSGSDLNASPGATAAVSADVPNKDRVQGVIAEEGGEAYLKTKDDGIYTIANADQLPRFTQPFPLHLKTKRQGRGGSYYVKIESADIKSVGRWRIAFDQVIDLRIAPSLKLLDERMQSLNRVVVENLLLPQEDLNFEAVIGEYRAARKLLESSYPTIKDVEMLRVLLELKHDLESEQRLFFHNKIASEPPDGPAHIHLRDASLVDKRFYQLNDNYRPEVYAMISNMSASAVAIARKGQDVPLGSGGIIGPNIVLTARHNIGRNTAQSFEASDYTILFDFEERRLLEPLKPIEYDCKEIYRSATLDFVLLEIRRRASNSALGPSSNPSSSSAPNANGSPVPTPTPPTAPSPIPISTARVTRWTPIFLIGYPQGLRRTVHDGAWILFPDRLVSNEERGELQSEIAAESVDWTEGGEIEVKTEKGLMKAVDFMDDYYGPTLLRADATYTYVREGQPTIGAECDTFRGDSGAPAILRENGRLIGMLYRGLWEAPGETAATSERKVRVSSRPGAGHHELILPASAIVADLRDNFPEWQTRGIVVVD